MPPNTWRDNPRQVLGVTGASRLIFIERPTVLVGLDLLNACWRRYRSVRCHQLISVLTVVLDCTPRSRIWPVNVDLYSRNLPTHFHQAKKKALGFNLGP
jgi:hypothetical protein